jgi:hypothetical protein
MGLLNEGPDIKGIDELVYNPVTKSGGAVGHGYDNGKRREGITWHGHDNHLHIAFTDKEVAMKVIDKSHEMGLYSTENPYAKNDPDGKVNYVHTKNSFHYQMFPGYPKVGKAVDISGDSKKMEDFIKWIDSTYAGVGNAPTTTGSNDEVSLLDKILNYDIGGKKIGDAINDTGSAIGDVFEKIIKSLI